LRASTLTDRHVRRHWRPIRDVYRRTDNNIAVDRLDAGRDVDGNAQRPLLATAESTWPHGSTVPANHHFGQARPQPKRRCLGQHDFLAQLPSATDCGSDDSPNPWRSAFLLTRPQSMGVSWSPACLSWRRSPAGRPRPLARAQAIPAPDKVALPDHAHLPAPSTTGTALMWFRSKIAIPQASHALAHYSLASLRSRRLP
jgi:hypothetical protein